jgi:pantothenate kinase
MLLRVTVSEVSHAIQSALHLIKAIAAKGTSLSLTQGGGIESVSMSPIYDHFADRIEADLFHVAQHSRLLIPLLAHD